jgi:hypothetical protein
VGGEYPKVRESKSSLPSLERFSGDSFGLRSSRLSEEDKKRDESIAAGSGVAAGGFPTGSETRTTGVRSFCE